MIMQIRTCQNLPTLLECSDSIPSDWRQESWSSSSSLYLIWKIKRSVPIILNRGDICDQISVSFCFCSGRSPLGHRITSFSWGALTQCLGMWMTPVLILLRLFWWLSHVSTQPENKCYCSGHLLFVSACPPFPLGTALSSHVIWWKHLLGLQVVPNLPGPDPSPSSCMDVLCECFLVICPVDLL